jgi:hypothetical protein
MQGDVHQLLLGLFYEYGSSVDVNGASWYAGRRSESRPEHPDFVGDSWPCLGYHLQG